MKEVESVEEERTTEEAELEFCPVFAKTRLLSVSTTEGGESKKSSS